MLSFAVFFPIAAGTLMFLLPDRRVLRCILTELVTILTSVSVFYALVYLKGRSETVLPITGTLSLAFHLDGAGAVFAALSAFLWPLAVLYAFEYMRHEGGERHFFPLYTISFGVTLGVAFAGNLLTMYIFYELLSLATLPLVIHGSKPESERAGTTYMYYTFGGAALALIGTIPLLYFTGGSFLPGGILPPELSGRPGLMQFLFLCCALGFGVKAAIMPFHSWLPKAAVAPTPVTALLHAAAVVKAGAFAYIRISYFSFGAEVLRGTVAQLIMILLASITIVYGALCAVREHHLKRRLAWSTVSNLSYIMLSASLFTEAGLTGAFTHLLFHALMKITLFFTAGAILVRTGKTEIEEMRGLSASMPVTTTVYMIGAFALSGLPILPGFASKWMIGTAAISAGPLGFLGLAALLTSAVLCGIYALTPGFSMLFRSTGQESEHADPGAAMTISLICLTLAIFLAGLFSNTIIHLVAAAAAASM